MTMFTFRDPNTKSIYPFYLGAQRLPPLCAVSGGVNVYHTELNQQGNNLPQQVLHNGRKPLGHFVAFTPSATYKNVVKKATLVQSSSLETPGYEFNLTAVSTGTMLIRDYDLPGQERPNLCSLRDLIQPSGSVYQEMLACQSSATPDIFTTCPLGSTIRGLPFCTPRLESHESNCATSSLLRASNTIQQLLSTKTIPRSFGTPIGQQNVIPLTNGSEYGNDFLTEKELDMILEKALEGAADFNVMPHANNTKTPVVEESQNYPQCTLRNSESSSMESPLKVKDSAEISSTKGLDSIKDGQTKESSESLPATSNLDKSNVRRRPRKQPHPQRSPTSNDPNFRGIMFSINVQLVDEESRLVIYTSYRRKKRVFRRRARRQSTSSSDSLTGSENEEPEPNFYRSALYGKECASCGTRKTPLWRDAEDGTPLCNACGIRYKKYRIRCTRCWHIPKKNGKSYPVCSYCGSPLRYIIVKRNGYY